MRAIVTGQIGMEKKPYLDAVARFAGQQGENLALYHVGDMMYAEGTDVRAGRILDLPISRLNSLRRAAVKDIIAESTTSGPGGTPQPNIIVNTHATFRWRHGLFAAFDYDQIAKLQPDVFICLVDNIEVVHHRLHREHDIDATLKDCMVWREEEILATELLSKSIPTSQFYIMARGRHTLTTRTLFRLVCRPHMKKVYPSFPMSHVMDMPDIMAEIDRFRAALADHARLVLRPDDDGRAVLEAVDAADLLAVADDLLAGVELDLLRHLVRLLGDGVRRGGRGLRGLAVGQDLGQVGRGEGSEQEGDGEDDAQVEEVDETIQRVAAAVLMPMGARGHPHRMTVPVASGGGAGA